MRSADRIYVAGHRGLVGSALVRRLRAEGYTSIITRSRAELDLADEPAVRAFFAAERPQYVFLAAAKVGGIVANDRFPAAFIRDNLAIELAVVDAAYRNGVQKLMLLGSSCVYPRNAPQPMQESCLLTGALEPTNEAYAIAKIAGIKLCDAYRRQYGVDYFTAMPTNLYGPHDNFDPELSHVLPALIRRFHEARLTGAPTVAVWGSGTPRREFMHVDDLADACVFLMRSYDEGGLINVGVGEDITIRELAALVRDLVGYNGEIVWDASKPDGTPRKLLDVSRLHARGWRHRIDLRTGIADTYQWFRETAAAGAATRLEAGTP